MREWFTPAEIIAAKSPELPASVSGLNRLAKDWRADPARARPADGKGGGWLYHVTVLPPGAQARLALQHGAADRVETKPVQDEASKALWARYEALSKGQKEECERRLDALVLVERYVTAGRRLTAAAALAANETGISTRTLFTWRNMVASIPRADWLAALAPEYKVTASFADCHPAALDVLKSDWLRAEKPSFSACYRRMRKTASKNGWLPIPSERALRRRVESEVPAGAIILAREGRDKAKTLYPAQKRSRAMLHAMQAVNIDGHKFDVFVRFADGSIGRPCMIALQDLYSGKFVAWRHTETENKVATRLVIGDMVERHGIPEKIVLDNGRAFSSKWITGGAPNRYRFKIRDEEPQGLVVSLGIDPRWTQPYSGQSKPIERAFRDLCDDIARHPFCAGAYTGNSPAAKPENYASRAIPFEEFKAFADAQMAEHNARPGRKAETTAGRSFDETFASSLADAATIVRWPTAAQRSLWLLAAEQVTARRGSGEIHLFENRYWAPALNQHAGLKVTVRFDPDNLHAPLKVYGIDDSFICEAECVERVGFFDAEAAQRTARDRKALIKANRDLLDIHRKLSADELGRLLYDGAEKPTAQAPMPPKVKRLATGGAAPAVAADNDIDFEASFSRGLRRLVGDADVIPFPPIGSGSG